MRGWKYGCAECPATDLSKRVEAGGYRCEACYHIMSADERVERSVDRRDPDFEPGTHWDLRGN